MMPDGSFRTAPPPGTVPFSTKLVIYGALIAVVGVALAVAFLAIWVVAMLLPVIVIAGGVAYLAMRWRRWQSLRGKGKPPSVFQPGRFGQ